MSMAVASFTRSFTFLRQSTLSTSQVAEAEWSQSRRFAKSVIDSSMCGLLIASLIMFNMCLIVYETNLRASDRNSTPTWVKYVSIGLLCFYSVEIVTRLYVERSRFFFNLMNLLDCFVVLVDVSVELLDGSLTSSALLRNVRVTRLLRSLLRTVRIMRYCRELYLMMHGFVAAMKALSWAFILIMLVLSICAIVAVELLHPINLRIAETGAYDDCERCPRAFASVQQATLTFIQQIIAGDSWGQVTIPIIEEEPWTALIFLCVLLCVNIGLLNLVLTVIVDSAHDAREHDVQQRMKDKEDAFAKARKQLLAICTDMDMDRSGALTLDEVLAGYDNNKMFADTLKLMDARRDDIPTIFAILDADKSGDVTSTEFVDELYKMKTQNTHTMLVFLKHSLNEVRDNVTLMKDQLVVQAQVHERHLDRIFRAFESSREWNGRNALDEPTQADVERNRELKLQRTVRETDAQKRCVSPMQRRLKASSFVAAKFTDKLRKCVTPSLSSRRITFGRSSSFPVLSSRSRSDDTCGCSLVKQSNPPADVAQLPSLLPKVCSEPRINVQSEAFVAQQSLRSDKSNEDVVLPAEDVETKATIADGEALSKEFDMPKDTLGFFVLPPRISPTSGTYPLASNNPVNTIRTHRSFFTESVARAQQHVSQDHPVQGLAVQYMETVKHRNTTATKMYDETRLPPSPSEQLWATSACSNV